MNINRTNRSFVGTMLTLALPLAAFLAGCDDGTGTRTAPVITPPVDTTAPTVSSTNPGDGATGMFLNSNLTATFSEAMDPASCNATTFTLKDMSGATPAPITGTVTCMDRTATFDPSSDLAVSTLYSATVTNGMKDKAGNALAVNKVWTFTTGAAADTTAPTVSSTNPVDLATGALINSNLTATFSEAINPATVSAASFTLGETVAGTSVSGSVTSVGNVATFDPTSDLAPGTEYTATVTTGIADLAGNALAANKVWTFTTASNSSVGPAPVLLGSAASFAILSKAGITDVPSSMITGDVGASPITGAAILLTCSEVTGTIYSVDAAGPVPCAVNDATFLTSAVSDMELAYTDAAGRSNPDFTEQFAGDLGGQTLSAGLYKWGTSVIIPTDVTLSGGADDVWILQIAGDLTVSNATIVHLSGGAQAKNIFWQVAGGGVLGTTVQFEGNLLSQTAITLATGAVVNGRLLAQTAVSLQSSTVTRP